MTRNSFRTAILATAWASCCGAVVFCGAVASAADTSAPVTKAERKALWSNNIQLVEQLRSSKGDVSTLASRLDSIRLPEVAQWVDHLKKLLDEQEERRAADYAKYVKRAKEHIEKGELREALIEANRALDNAADPDEFRSLPWLKELEERAVARAKELRAEAEWRRAYEIYYSLSNLFEDHKEYTRLRDDSLTFARLDAVYDKDSRWQERLEGIVPRNAFDALDRIDRQYVEEADFKKVTEAGLEHLLLICESKVMRETFDGLADDEDRESFCDRLRERLEQVKRSESLTVRDAKWYFRRALKINQDTVRLPKSLIVYEFMTGAVDPLDDFTSVIWPVEFKEFDKHTRGDFVGVGISITGGGSRPIRVVSPLSGTPAYRAGIIPDDEITHVNGKSLEGVTVTKAVQMITGPIGTEVTLTIRRPSEGRSFDVVLRRDKIEIQSVMGYRRDPDDPQLWDYLIDKDLGIAYVQLVSFQDNTADQLQRAIDQALAAGARGLILDLRFNPGGLLKSAVEVTRLFQTKEEQVVSTRGLRDRPWSPPPASHDGPYVSLPLIVLVNQYSASASEIVSGALGDNDRAVILGERTYGKFSVQKLMELGGSSAHLKLTTARYYLPSGWSLHHEEGATEWGVPPDVVVKLYPKEVTRVRLMQQARDILAKHEEKASKSAEGDGASGDSGDDASSGDDAAADAKAGDSGAETGDAKAKPDGDASKDGAEDQAGHDDAGGDSKDAEDADGENGDDEEDEDKLKLAPDPNEVPDVDLQLETALLLMRLQLIGEQNLHLAAGDGASMDGSMPKP